MRNIWGALVSLLFVALTVGAGTLLNKSGKLGEEGSRKFIHIVLSNWWLIAVAFYDNAWWAAAVPAVFVAVNALSYRFNIVKAMERGAGKGGLGTVWYAVSLLVMALWTFSAPGITWIGTIAILSMGYGDGLAAVIGQRYGRNQYPLKGMKKTLEGSIVLFAAVFAVSLTVLAIYRPENMLIHALILASAAMLLELAVPLGLDNLTLPIGLALLAWWMTLPGFPTDIALGLALSTLIVLPAWARKSLTLPASLGAAVMGTLIFWAGGWVFFSALGAFFLSSMVAGRLGKARKDPVAQLVHERHGTRSLVQVLVNGGVAMVCIVLYKLTRSEPLAVACLASFSAANADTWASEIGMLSRREPRSILTGKTLRRGLSGGVTALGFAGSVIGAAAITAVSLFHRSPADLTLAGVLVPCIVFAAGLAGSVLDSVLGDSVQAKFKHPFIDELTEKPFVNGVRTKLALGCRTINNDVVNLASCVAAALLGIAASLWIR